MPAGSIGLPHIHPFASKVPNRRLRSRFEEDPEPRQAKRLTLRSSLGAARLAFRDEQRQKLVRFRQALAA